MLLTYSNKICLYVIQLEGNRNISQWEPVVGICHSAVTVTAGFYGMELDAADIWHTHTFDHAFWRFFL